MTDTDEQQDQLIRLLSPELRIPRSVSQPTGHAAEEVRHLIMAVPEQDTQSVGVGHRRSPWSPRRRLIFAVPAVAGLAALAFVISAALPESSPVGPPPAQADTLQFAQDNEYIDIKILDPVADPERYKAELAEHGLNIDLILAPATPERVGRVIFQENNNGNGPSIETIEAPGDCSANGNCSVAIRVPLGYKGYSRIVFGRTPKPAETVEGDAPVLSPLQEAELRALVGKHVSDVRELLAARGQTATYRVGRESREATTDQVPGSWYVYEVAPLANDVVVLWVSKNGEAP